MTITPADLTRFAGEMRAAKSKQYWNMDKGELEATLSNETKAQLPDLLTAIYGDAAKCNSTSPIDVENLFILAKDEVKNDGYVSGNANNVTDKDLGSLAAKADAKATEASAAPPPVAKPAHKPYKSDGCNNIDPSAHAKPAAVSAWKATQAKIADMNDYVLTSISGSELTVKSGMTLGQIAIAILSKNGIKAGDATYKADLKKLTDELVCGNVNKKGVSTTTITVGQKIDLTGPLAAINAGRANPITL